LITFKKMPKGGYARRFSKVCRDKGVSTPEEVISMNLKYMAKNYDLSIIKMKKIAIQNIREQLTKDGSIPIKKVLTVIKKGKRRKNIKNWFRHWSGLAGGTDRLADGCRNFVGTYIPEAIFDEKKLIFRKRKPADPEPEYCAVLLNVMAEMFAEPDGSDTKKISSKVEGIAIKTEVDTEEIPDKSEIQGHSDHSVGHVGHLKGNSTSPKHIKKDKGKRRSCSAQALGRGQVQINNTYNRDGQYGHHGSRAGYGGYNFDRSRGGQYGNHGSRAGYGGYNFDRSRGGQYGSHGSRAGYGGYNSGRRRGTTDNRFHPY